MRERERCSQALHLELLDRAYQTLATHFFAFCELSRCFLPFSRRSRSVHIAQDSFILINRNVNVFIAPSSASSRTSPSLMTASYNNLKTFSASAVSLQTSSEFFPLPRRLVQRALFLSMNFLWALGCFREFLIALCPLHCFTFWSLPVFVCCRVFFQNALRHHLAARLYRISSSST